MKKPLRALKRGEFPPGMFALLVVVILTFMRYSVAIHKDPHRNYSVTVPGLPGCFSAGGTMDEALGNAVEAIECHPEEILADGEAIPMPKTVEGHRQNPGYADGIWVLVDVDFSKLSGETKRVNITLPERILALIDKYAATSL